MNISFVQKAVVVLLSSAFIFTSCNKDNPDPTVVYQNSTTSGGTGGGGGVNPNPNGDYFNADVDGNAFVGANFMGAFSMGNLTISSSDNSNSYSIGLTVPEYITTGTYALDGFTPPVAFYTVGNGINDMFFANGTGTLEITEHDETNDVITGTFEFVAYNSSVTTTTYNITNGEFSVHY